MPQSVIDWDESIYLLMARSVLGAWSIGALAALFYAVFSMQNGGLASNAEIMLAPFTVAAFLLLGWRTGVPAAIRPGRRLAFLAIGLLLGAAIQIKAVAGMELLAVLALLGLTPLLARRAGRPLHLRETVLAAGLVMLGALLPMLAVAGAFALIGLIVAIGLAQPAARPLRHSLEEVQALVRRTPRVELLVSMAAYLRERMGPDDTIFVAEGPPILHYLTDAPLPTRYVLPPLLNDDLAPMTGIDPLAELERIMALRPRYVVLSENYQRDPAFLARLQAHLAQDYVLERSIQGILLYRLAS